MPTHPHSDAILVSGEAFASSDPYDLIWSNIDVVNKLQERHFTHDEISRNALRSYYVDYFLAQLNNGGFSQFVYNSRWGASVDYVTEGFAAIGAARHLELFEDAAAHMCNRKGIRALKRFFASSYFGKNRERDILNRFSDGFFSLQETEDLIELNSKWLRSHPALVVLSKEQIQTEIDSRAANVPDMAARIKAALAAEPRFKKLIRALCNEAGQELALGFQKNFDETDTSPKIKKVILEF